MRVRMHAAVRNVLQVRCPAELPSWAAIMPDKLHHNSLPGCHHRQLRPWLFW